MSADDFEVEAMPKPLIISGLTQRAAQEPRTFGAHIDERRTAIAGDLAFGEIHELRRHPLRAEVAYHPAEQLRELEVRKHRLRRARNLNQVAPAGGAARERHQGIS